MDKIHSLTGMLDLYEDGDSSDLSKNIFETEKRIKNIFSNYYLKEIRTPALEDTDLFKRSAGDISDIVNKEIYSFQDRNDKSISLRPEGTASVIRSVIEKKLDQSTHKLWYMGPMWRYERPQKGRYRQFYQAGVEILGYPEGAPEFEMVSLVCSIIEEFNIADCTLKINHLGNQDNKKAYCDALIKFLEPLKKNLDEKDLERLSRNPLRVLDSKNQDTQLILKDAPSLKEFLETKSIELLEAIKDEFSDVCNIEIDYTLVRGLDYYSGFVFEALSSNLGAQDSFLGGGRYDDLCSKLGGKDLPSIGMAIGIERFASLVSDTTLSDKIVSFITLGSILEPKTYKIAHRLRSLNKNIILDMQLSDSSLKAKLRRANKNNSEYAVIVGEEEFNNGTFIIKPLKDELKEQQTVSIDELFEFYKAL
ncbi:MAG: histidine--tRNA ligase [Gammaproteobacteria bacterium]|nr:histidine--tRNA ligase [Gammaproteobacteria bacterium]